MLVLTSRIRSTIPVELGGITPDRIHTLKLIDIAKLHIKHGNQTMELGELFDLCGSATDGCLDIRGDTQYVKQIGLGMESGSITCETAGMHAGAGMLGGTLTITGNAGDWLGAEMRGGVIEVHGDVGNQVGAAYRGSRRGVLGGNIIIHGNAGDELGLLMRRGVIIVLGNCGEFTGASMIAGTIFLMGKCSRRLGVGMKRGTILANCDYEELQPSFQFSCVYEPTFLNLYDRALQVLGGAEPSTTLQSVNCYRGDQMTGGRGEILVPVIQQTTT